MSCGAVYLSLGSLKRRDLPQLGNSKPSTANIIEGHVLCGSGRDGNQPSDWPCLRPWWLPNVFQ